MSKAKNGKNAIVAVPGEQFIPLRRLKKSPRNARKMPHPPADVEALPALFNSHLFDFHKG